MSFSNVFIFIVALEGPLVLVIYSTCLWFAGGVKNAFFFVVQRGVRKIRLEPPPIYWAFGGNTGSRG